METEPSTIISERSDQASVNKPPLSLVKRIGKKIFVRIILVTLALLVYVGAMFNDGLFGYLYAFPMVIVIYLSLSLSKKWKMILAVFLLLVVYMLGENIGKLQYVYPVIGQHVEFTKDVHVISYRDSPTVLSYDRWTAMLEVDPSLKWGEDSRNDFVTQKGTFQSGNIGTVVRVERRSNGLSPSLAYVISVGGREIEISIQELHNHSFENKYEAASFCGKVKWEFCSETLQNGFFPDSMNPNIRRISNLVYFWIPVFFFGFVLEG